MTPQFLTIGHVTRDIQSDGSSRLGGAVTFASVTARQLGLGAAIITSATREDLDAISFDGIELCGKPCADTTTFRNVYRDDGRRQYLLRQATCLTRRDVPTEWSQPGIVLLAPVAHEIDTPIVKAFPHSLTALMLQGVLRRWDSTGMVRHGNESLAGFLDGPQIAVGSMEDIGENQQLLHELEQQPSIVALTSGRAGSTIREGNRVHHVPAFPAREVDPTGAGDVFASAFVIAYRIYGDCWKAAVFASCAAALSVEQPGISGIPDLATVLHRLKTEGIDV